MRRGGGGWEGRKKERRGGGGTAWRPDKAQYIQAHSFSISRSPPLWSPERTSLITFPLSVYSLSLFRSLPSTFPFLRSHRLKELRQCQIFELDVKPVLDYKSRILASVLDRFPLLARGMHRLVTDFSDDVAWVNILKSAGFDPNKKTIWILEGFLYYLETSRAQALLRTIQAESAPGSIVLADHINDFTLTSLRKQASNKWLTSTFSSAMEVPETAVAALGFEGVEVVTVGEEGANFGLWGLPVVPRKENNEVMRTYLFQARVGGVGGKK